VLIGASRGLGAALALELAAEACTVIGVYARSTDDALALLRAAAADHLQLRHWISRPGKIDTDLINTPMSRDGAEKPHVLARRIFSALT
jgi:NAD(P)-dependent dehydrogenase (short-subunit alcohol dehydrogenase family)